MEDRAAIETKIRKFILAEFLPDEDPELLTAETPLISAGVLDSLATMTLVRYLEKEFGITIEAHEADAEYLDTTAQITALVASRSGASA